MHWARCIIRSTVTPRLTLPVLLLLALVSTAHARQYPITRSDSSGTWIGGPEGLLHGQGELWTRYHEGKGLPTGKVMDIELSSRSVWVATPAGLARMDKGSRRWERFGPPDLPSAQVTGVSMDASDPDQLWVSTLGGLVRHDVRQNRWTPFGRARGLPSERVNDVFFRGRTVWAATDAGLAAMDLRRGTVQVFTEADGMAPGPVLELSLAGSDLWITSAGGLSRMNLQRRTFAAFGKAQGLPAGAVLSTARLQSVTYIVTAGGLITYDGSADALAPFLHAKGLQGASVRGVVSAGGFVWFATGGGLCRFEPVRKSWEYYRLEDGASSDELSRLAVAGGNLLIFHDGGELDTYDFKKDEWVDRSSLLEAAADEPPAGAPGGGTDGAAEPDGAPAAAQDEERPLELSFSAELDTEFDGSHGWAEGEDGWGYTGDGTWKFNTVRLGGGARWGRGRTVDVSAKIDWGDIYPALDPDATSDTRTSTLITFQQYDLSLRYLGARGDWLREVYLSDEVRLDPEGGALTERTEVEGGRVVLDLGPRRREGKLLEVKAAAGLRRGTPMRLVFRHPNLRQLELMRFQLMKSASEQVRFVIPSSVRVMLDGRELERNVDYFVDHTTGLLWITNKDLFHAMRVVEVDLEYEQIPRKNVGVVTVTDMLPKDGEIGQLKRSGRSRWAKDEQGLFDEIDGGAEQYINRGWDQTLSQDYTWGSAGATLRIHDMDSAESARAILLARLAGDAKPAPGFIYNGEDAVYIEKQSSSLMVKMLFGKFFIEITLDEASMEQEILSIASWLFGKLGSSGKTSADALRDLVVSTGALLRLSDEVTMGATYLGGFSVDDDALPDAASVQRNLLALHGAYSASVARDVTLTARAQAAVSSAEVDSAGRFSGAGVRADALLASPWLVLSLDGRKYTRDYVGLGVARQSEFCRASDGACDARGESQLDHELSARGTIKALSWLPLDLAYQRQVTALGSDYADAPADRSKEGVRDVASGKLTLQRKGLPRVSVHGGYIRRDDAMTEQDQLVAGAAVEADLANTLLKGLAFKKIYLRGLYEYGHGAVDESRVDSATERDRTEGMHHAVAEARVAPTLTESGYVSLAYHGLRGVLDTTGDTVDLLQFWRLDGGASSSWIPGIALRFDSTLWFKDEMPLLDRFSRQGTLASARLNTKRDQAADSRLAGVVEVFPGEWVDKLSSVKMSATYTYSERQVSQGAPRGSAPPGRERCDVAGDEDLDGLSDCADPDCALTEACLQVTGTVKTHRAYGTVTWDTPGKVQVELFGDLRESYAGQGQARRLSRQEVRSFVTWRPIYPSPITLRFDMLREWKDPETYDKVVPDLDFTTTAFTPALEWRRRWSQQWWHLAKVSYSHNQVRDQPHIRTHDDLWGKKGDVERLSYDSQVVTPSVEVRRRFEDDQGRWSVRPFARLRAAFTWGAGVQSQIDSRICLPGEACLVDDSSEEQTYALTLGMLWTHADLLFIDFDITASYIHRDRCKGTINKKVCGDELSLTPHLLATVRY